MGDEADHGRVAPRLREAIRRKGWTLQRLADELGWSKAKLSRMGTGSGPTTMGDLVKVAGALGVPVAHLLPPEMSRHGRYEAQAVPLIPLHVLSALRPVEIEALLDSWAGETTLAVASGPRTLATRVECRAMDRLIPPGSIVLVDTADRALVDGRRYLVIHRGQATFRELAGRRLVAMSTQRRHEAIDTASGELEIVGRVYRVMQDI